MTPTTIADDIEEDEDAPPRRSRAQAAFAFASEPIPFEVNAAFLADLAFERAISMALDLASSRISIGGPDDPPVATAVLEPEAAAPCAVSPARDLAL